MTRPSDRDIKYKEAAQKLTWDDLRLLWRQIKAGATPDWDEGKALEHVVIRAFTLSGLRAEYPYDVPPGGRRIEQIDGVVFLDHLPFLSECKGRNAIDFSAIAKLHIQLLRRPPTTMGCVFSTGGYTSQALILADYAVPHRITLWSDEDIETALEAREFKEMLMMKYDDLYMLGLTDYSPSFRTAEVKDE